MRLAGCSAGGMALVLTIAAATAASPFDGSYVGTSASFGGTTGGGRVTSCAQFSAPPPMSGTVDAQGRLIMHSAAAGKFEGQIDAAGTLKGGYVGYCVYTLTWQRKS